MISYITELWDSLFAKKKDDEVIRYGGCYLPSTRSNESLDDNRAYIESIVSQIDSLRGYISINSKTQILDFGCGQGRLANGLIHEGIDIAQYHGIDTHKGSIDWCRKWIEENSKNYNFTHLPAKNERYNPGADSLQKLPYSGDSFDFTFLNSVFSHMMEDDVRFYLAELHRVLNVNGLIYITAFIEDGVRDVEENPRGYLGKESVGSLHRVRYERIFFMKMLECAGFVDIDVQHRAIERTQQSVVTARKGGNK